MRFEFATSNRILFGEGVFADVGKNAASFGKRAFLVADSFDRAAGLFHQLDTVGIFYIPCPVETEPSINSIEMAMRNARESACDLVISMGGGSALDTGKTVAALLTNPGPVLDFIEVVGNGRSFENPSTPFIAIPTTSGTGSEVTRNAVVSIPEHRLKASLRSPFLLPNLAVVDPELTCSLPPGKTAETGMDALTQLVEPFLSNAATPLTDALCRDGITRVGKSLLAAYRDGENKPARQDMSLASLFGGLALANAKLGAVHGLANPIGGACLAPHGAVCARLLPLVMECNYRALQAREPASSTLERFNEIGRLLTGKPSAGYADALGFINYLSSSMGIRPLADYGLQRQDFPWLIGQSHKASSMKGNPIHLMDEEILAVLENAI